MGETGTVPVEDGVVIILLTMPTTNLNGTLTSNARHQHSE